MMNCFQTLLSTSTCATTAWSARARAVAAAPALRAAAALDAVSRAGLGFADLPAVKPSDADDDKWMFEEDKVGRCRLTPGFRS